MRRPTKHLSRLPLGVALAALLILVPAQAHAAPGDISTFAGSGSAGFSGDGGQATSTGLDAPTDVAVDSQGRLHIVEYGGHRVRRVSASGTISTVAGNGSAGSSGDGGAATSARLDAPAGIAIGSSDELVRLRDPPARGV